MKRLQRYREVAATFPTSGLPPMMSGHWLLKRNQASLDRTWTDASPAVDWMTKHHEDNPPVETEDGQQAYGDLATKREYALAVLPGGVDVSWVYYTKSGNIVSISLVCCPNIHHPDLACPLPSAL
ncbi:hypothetical protein AB0E88_13870 [Streptomyces sp. NPDC028635]|uniref:hypothetical protein n=1 Tax=Streptomyces sp. NPDC028635 TaxID=3154800 RepID=UPI003410E3AC